MATRPEGTVAARDRRDRSSSLSPGRRGWSWVKQFFRKAYEDNLTGLSGMLAYNLLLSLLPVTLLALFVAGQVLQSGEVERNVLADLRDLFPDTAESTLTNLLEDLRDFSTSLGIAALVASVWIGTSFWGALDTAFCTIYHVRCRSWLEQKRFALAMLVVALLFIFATVIVPTAQGLLTATAEELPFGLSDIPGLRVRRHAGREPAASVRDAVRDLLGRAQLHRALARDLARGGPGHDRNRDRGFRVPVLSLADLHDRAGRHDTRVHRDRPAVVLRAGNHRCSAEP